MGSLFVKMDDIKTIAILGSGAMGIDLGVLVALHGFDVILWHRKDRRIAYDRLVARLEKYTAKGILSPQERQTAISHIISTSELDSLSNADLVIETIVEDFVEKSTLLDSVARIVSDTCIITSNTSSLSIENLATQIRNPTRFAGLHFFNPALKMELVEIVTCSKTLPETICALRKVVAHIGKTAVEVKDAPGFIVNRLMACQINQAIRMFEQDVASIEDIDQAVALGLIHPIGPFALADLIGLDVLLEILTILFNQTHDSAFDPANKLINMVQAGQLGRKSKTGFYNYDK